MVTSRKWLILGLWLIAACAGLIAASGLADRLSNVVGVPGSPSQETSSVLEDHFHESVKGSFALLVEASPSHWASRAFVHDVRASVRRAARAAEGRASPLQSTSPKVSYATLPTELSPTAAQDRIPQIERAAGQIDGAHLKVTGFPVISDELSQVIAHDLRRAEAVAIPITALILLLLFGSLPAVAVPLLFAFATISVASGLIWLESWFIEIPVYATSVVTLVGIALAVDYSMLYVARYREEARNTGPEGIRPLAMTAQTAGRSLIISGVVVAAGLLPLAFMPIPFFSGLGLATIMIPLVSVLAAMTLLPTVLEVLGPHLERMPVSLRRRKRQPENSSRARSAERLAKAVMRRPVLCALSAGTIMVLIAVPVTSMGLTGGSSELLKLAQLPSSTGNHDQNTNGTALAPYEVVIDSRRAGAAWATPTLKAERHLVASLATDPGVTTIQAPVETRSRRSAHRLGLVNETSRFSRMRIAGADESGSRSSEALVERLRDDYIPKAGFGEMRVWVGGPAAADYDFVHAVTANTPVTALAIIVVMLLLLTLMLKSVVLPLKAIAMSALSVAAACGVMVMVFQFGWGEVIGFPQSERIEAWVPVLLFAALFGISTDYEIFMVTRMREEWLGSGDNQHAVQTGLQFISRVITASALVMIVIFAGFTTSRVVALQEFGVGLVAGVFFEATLVRLLLVPSLMRLLGRWNWTLTPSLAIGRNRQTPASEERSA